MTFQKQYLKILDIVSRDIERVSEKAVYNSDFREPLKSVVGSFLLTPSKKIRTLVTLLCLRAYGADVTENHIKLLAAVELIHNASLIHDDIIDESDTRRNEQTINSAYDNKLAVISGDYILSAALKFLNELNSPEIIAAFAETLSQMCESEAFQYFHKFKIYDIDDYLKKTNQKTAKLFATAAKTAFLLSKSDKLKAAEDFAENFGMAFQIRDDIINLKTTQTDLKSGIYNAPIIYSNDISDYESGIEKTCCLLNNYIERARKIADEMPDNIYGKGLLELLGLFENA